MGTLIKDIKLELKMKISTIEYLKSKKEHYWKYYNKNGRM